MTGTPTPGPTPPPPAPEATHAHPTTAAPATPLRLEPVEAALIAETCSRGEVCWLRPGSADRHTAAWHAWHDDTVCVLSGPGEQTLPELDGEVEVVARAKESLARLITFLARAEVLDPGTDRWSAAARTLLAHRLNLADPDQAPSRWRDGCRITLLHPVQLLAGGNGTDLAGADRAAPRRGPATTTTRSPFHLGRRTARRR